MLFEREERFVGEGEKEEEATEGERWRESCREGSGGEKEASSRIEEVVSQ